MTLSSTAVDLLGAWIGKKHRVLARNRLLHTDDLTDAVWLTTSSPSEVTVSLEAGETNPLGGTGDVYKVTKVSGGGVNPHGYVSQVAQSYMPSVADVASVWVKRASGHDGVTAAGLVIDDGTGNSVYAAVPPTSWARWEKTRTLQGGATQSEIRIQPDRGSATTNSILVWRPQLEYGERPTQYQEIVEGFDEFPGPVVFAMTVDLYDIGGAATETLYFADVQYRTSGSDTPANQLFLPRLSPPDISSSLMSGGKFGRQAVTTVGVIKIDNSDGGLDAYLDPAAYDWVGRTFTVKVGADDWPYTEFETLISGKIKDITFNAGEIRLTLKSGLVEWDEPVQQNLFTGDGEAILDSDNNPILDSDNNSILSGELSSDMADQLEGVKKPLMLGRPFNVAPIVVDGNYGAGYLKYMLHDGEIHDVYDDTTVYEGGLEMTIGVDFDFDAAGGFIFLYSVPTAVITVRVDGGKYSLDGGAAETVETAGKAARAILEHYANLTPPTQIDEAAFDAYDDEVLTLGTGGDQTFYQTGIWANAGESYSEVLSQLFAPYGWWGTTMDGSKVTCGYLKDPSGESADVSFDTADIKSIERLKTPAPIWNVDLNVEKNHTIISEPLGAVSDTWREKIAREYTTWKYGEDDEGVDIKTDHAAASDGTVLAGAITTYKFETGAGASTSVEENYFDLMSEPRDILEVSLAGGVGSVWIGNIVEITYDRFTSMASGKKFYCTGVRWGLGSQEHKLTLWG